MRRAVAGQSSSPAGTILPALGVAAFGVAAWLAGTGRFRPAAAVLALAAVAMLAGAAARSSSRWVAYGVSVVDAVGDAAVLAALAWPLRLAQNRVGAAVVAAIGLTFLGAYAQVRGASLKYRVPVVVAGAPERALVLAAGLLAPDLLEMSLWLIAADGALTAMRTTAAVWKQSP